MKLITIITTLFCAFTATATHVAATYDSDSRDGIANDERIDETNPSISNFNVEDFETMLLSTNRNPLTCTFNCGCPLSNPSCTLSACTSNCSYQNGTCSMPTCTSNCKCQGGSCDMPMCTTNCKCQNGSCSMPKCTSQCKCSRGGCFSSEQEEFLSAMEQDIRASAQTVPKRAPRLRGASQAAVLDHSYEPLVSLAKRYRMTAEALLKTASLAMDLSNLDDLASIEEAKDQVLRAAQVAEAMGDDAVDEAEEVFDYTESYRQSNRHAEAKQMFYYYSGKAAQKTNQATSKAANKTQQATSKANVKTDSAIQKANSKTASVVAKAETTAAYSFLDTAGALDNAAALTADAILLGSGEAIDAANLAAYEAAYAAGVANDSLKHAAEVTMGALSW